MTITKCAASAFDPEKLTESLIPAVPGLDIGTVNNPFDTIYVGTVVATTVNVINVLRKAFTTTIQDHPTAGPTAVYPVAHGLGLNPAHIEVLTVYPDGTKKPLASFYVDAADDEFGWQAGKPTSLNSLPITIGQEPFPDANVTLDYEVNVYEDA